MYFEAALFIQSRAMGHIMLACLLNPVEILHIQQGVNAEQLALLKNMSTK